MDKDWILLTKETRRTFSSSTWVPLRASGTDEKGDVKEIGFVSCQSACNTFQIRGGNGVQ